MSQRRRITDLSLQRLSTGDIWDSVVIGLSARRQTPKGTISWSFRRQAADGRYRRATIGHWPDMPVNEARRAAKLIIDAEETTRRRPLARDSTGGTLRQVLDDLETRREDDRVKVPRTLDEYRRSIERDAAGLIDVPVVAIETEDVLDVLDDVHSASARQHLRAYLSKAMRHAIWLRWRRTNPVAVIPTIPVDSESIEDLTESDLRAWWRSADESDAPSALALQLQLLSGGRPMMMRTCTWRQVRGGRIRWDRTKMGHEHVWYLSDLAGEILERLRPLTRRTGYLCPNIHGVRPIKRFSYRQACARLADRAGVRSDCGPKMLQKTSLSMLAEILGPESDTLLDLYGAHRPKGITQDIYVQRRYRQYRRQLTEASASLSARVMEILDNPAAEGSGAGARRIEIAG